MGLNKWFDQGLTAEQYIETLEKHKEAFSHIHKNFSLPEDEKFFQTLKEKDLRTVVLAEPWCGHCMLNIPVLLHLAENADIPVRFLLRDQNLELMDQYLTNGNRTIPVVIFIDQDGNEVTKWGPIAEKTREFIAPLRAELPSKDDENYQEKFQEMIQITAKEFRENKDLWHGSYDSIKETLSQI